MLIHKTHTVDVNSKYARTRNSEHGGVEAAFALATECTVATTTTMTTLHLRLETTTTTTIQSEQEATHQAALVSHSVSQSASVAQLRARIRAHVRNNTQGVAAKQHRMYGSARPHHSHHHRRTLSGVETFFIYVYV